MFSVIIPPVFFLLFLSIGVYKFVTDSKSTATGFALVLIIITVGTVAIYELLSAYGY